jgi:hypothetical protein
VNHLEIARVQLRKCSQAVLDLREQLHREVGAWLDPELQHHLAGEILTTSWIAGRGYEVAGATADHVTLQSPEEGQPPLRLRFLGRHPLGRFGGFAAEAYQEREGAWEIVAGPGDWGLEVEEETGDDRQAEPQ